MQTWKERSTKRNNSWKWMVLISQLCSTHSHPLSTNVVIHMSKGATPHQSANPGRFPGSAGEQERGQSDWAHLQCPDVATAGYHTPNHLPPKGKYYFQTDGSIFPGHSEKPSSPPQRLLAGCNKYWVLASWSSRQEEGLP